MRNKNLPLGIVLFALGMLGVCSLFTMKLPLDKLPAAITDRFSPTQIRLLVLLNPTILLMLMVALGTWLHRRAGLSVPTISGLLRGDSVASILRDQFVWGIGLGVVAGLLIVGVAAAFEPILGSTLQLIAQEVEPSLLSRLLYGGVTEELMVRFGIMTAVMVLAMRIWPNATHVSAWVAIILSTLLFAVGHLPAVYAAVPDPGWDMIAYVILGNSVAGLVFGWLYWKRGLEAAMIAHMMAHVVMVLLG